MLLFTHLKIILLQCSQFLVFSFQFSSISGIQTDPQYTFGQQSRPVSKHVQRFLWVPCIVHGTHKSLFSTKLLLKIGLMTLFTHLNLFCYSIFSFQFLTISSIQTDLYLLTKFSLSQYIYLWSWFFFLKKKAAKFIKKIQPSKQK